MARSRTWTLTDVHADIWQDNFSVGNNTLSLHTPHDWQVRKRILRGGLRDGVELIEVHNGSLAFSIIPTRGMGLWSGDYRGNHLGWRSPVHGPVHPRHVPLRDRGECGFLFGFDEWLCRCGLANNGPPGEDVTTDSAGKTHRTPLTLHGRICNLPAERVEVTVNLDPPHEISISGVVDESALFSPQLRLTTTYTTIPGSNRLMIHDVVENRSAHPAEMQLLYHINMGPPFLEPSARILAPIRQVSPQTAVAAEGIDTLEVYAPPRPGFAEQVYLYQLSADSKGQTLAALINSSADRCVALRFNTSELPCFTVWKQTGAMEEGYVTGLEPATNYPNFKTFERQNGRVKIIPPGGHWEARLAIEIHDTNLGVTGIQTEIAKLQALNKAIIHRQPQSTFTPAGRLQY